MANNLIQIKRSTTNASPASLQPGELAYSFNSNTLFIGNSTNGADTIGGLKFMLLLNGTPGTLTASKSIIVDSNSLLNQINIGNTTSNVVITSTGLVIANSTSNTAHPIPTSAQYTAGNYYLNANGSWVAITASVAGSNTQIQFNDSGAANGSASFTFDKSAVKLTVGNTTINTSITATQITIANGTTSATIPLPTAAQISGANYYLNANGNWTTVATGVATPAGANTQVQYNDSGASNAYAGFTFTKTSNTVFSGNSFVTGNSTANATMLATSYAVANATAQTTIVPTAITVGTATVLNTTAIAVGTVNAATVNATTSAAIPTISFGQTAANAVVNSTFATIQSNTTVNASLSATTLTLANAITTATLTPGQLSIGNSSVNTTLTATTLTTKDLTISGNLTVSGTTTVINGTTVQYQDNMIKLATNNTTTNTLDLGIYGVFGNSTVTNFTGMAYQASSGKWIAFTSNTTEPGTTVPTTPLATISANTFEAVNPIAVASGGTGKASFTGNAVVYTTNTTNLAFLSFGTDGQVLQMSGTSPAFGSLDGGAF